jgi:hypothetical protein
MSLAFASLLCQSCALTVVERDQHKMMEAPCFNGLAAHQQDHQLGTVARGGERERDAVHYRHADLGAKLLVLWTIS